MFGSSPQKKFLKAAANGDVAELNRCLTEDVPGTYPLETRDGYGRTALIMAAKEGKIDTVKILLAKKADINAADSEGCTALWWATYYSRTDVLKLLVASGADVNPHNKEYYYALHWAARNGDTDIVKALAEAGADLNPMTKGYLQTPMHMAVENRRNPAVEILLAHGARTDIKDCNNNTAPDRAKSIGIKALQEIFEAAQKKAIPAAPAVAIAPAAPAALPAAANDTAGEKWVLLAPDTVAHINTYPPISRRLTEIFNFGSRERTVITENLKTGAETMTPSEKFETLAEDTVAQAEAQLKAQGGAAPDKNQKKAFNL